jgi:hypothetical protein
MCCAWKRWITAVRVSHTFPFGCKFAPGQPKADEGRIILAGNQEIPRVVHEGSKGALTTHCDPVNFIGFTIWGTIGMLFQRVALEIIY